MNKTYKAGFTLVELSIVLVIIGLLIGGILVAQSLIDNAEMKNFVKRHGQFEIAVNQYKSRYKELPGDGPISFSFMKSYAHCAEGANSNVYKDGVLTINNGEQACAWAPLARARMIDVDLYLKLGSAFNSKCDVDRTTGNAEELAAWQCYPRPMEDVQGYIWFTGSQFSYRRYASSASDQLPFISAIKAFAIDAKYDDGVYNTGSFIANEWPDTGSCYSGGSYSLNSTNDQGCWLDISYSESNNVF